MEILGRGGELRIGYKVVAVLKDWRLDKGTVQVAAHEVSDPFWFGQDEHSFSVRLQAGKRMWVWDQADLVSRDPLTLRVVGDLQVR